MRDKMMKGGMDVENVGIMQGFLDDEFDDTPDFEDDDDFEDDGDDEDEKGAMERRPDSPEILMNNLRGDMRSIDARRDELADLVGYAAAAETPESVLAMLQPVLAQGGGIAALPQSAPMAQGPQPPMLPPAPPPMAAGAPPMPPGPPPMAPGAPTPIQMAAGGYVQRFQEGSDEDGVTPAESPSSLGFVPTPEMVEQARAQLTNMMAQKPLEVPDLRAETARRTKVYRDILGDNRESRQAQMLLSLGQRAFGFASNVDDQGRPLRGSFVGRLAGAVRTLPGEMAQYISATDKEQRQAKLMGLQAAEKEIAGTREQNLKLLESQRKAFGDILKAAGKSGAGGAQGGVFGRSVDGASLNVMYQMSEDYARGALTPEGDRIFVAATTNYTQPKLVSYTDAETGETLFREYRNELPPFAATALKTRRQMEKPRGNAGAGAGAPAPAKVPEAAPPEVKPLPATRGPRPEALGETPLAPVPGRTTVAPGSPAPDMPPEAQTAPESTFFDLAGTGTGFVPVLISGIARNVPLNVVGRIGSEYQQATTTIENMTRRVVNTLQENPRFAEGERKQIEGELKLAPRLLDNKESYINQLVSLDRVLADIEEKTRIKIETKKIGPTLRREARSKLIDIKAVRDMIGVRDRRINNTEEWLAAPPGEYLVYDPNKKIYVYAQKKGTK